MIYSSGSGSLLFYHGGLLASYSCKEKREIHLKIAHVQRGITEINPEIYVKTPKKLLGKFCQDVSYSYTQWKGTDVLPGMWTREQKI